MSTSYSPLFGSVSSSESPRTAELGWPTRASPTRVLGETAGGLRDAHCYAATPIPRGELARYQQIHLGNPQLPTTELPTVEKKVRSSRILKWSLETDMLFLADMYWWGYFSLEPTARVPMVSCFQHGLDAKVFFLETHSLPFAKVTQLPPAEQAHRPASWQVRDMVTWYTVPSCPLHIEKKNDYHHASISIISPARIE